jgi:hypothetical protein
MTITLYGSAEQVERLAGMIEALPGLQVDRRSDPVAVADGSGRFRLWLAVTL